MHSNHKMKEQQNIMAGETPPTHSQHHGIIEKQV